MVETFNPKAKIPRPAIERPEKPDQKKKTAAEKLIDVGRALRR